MGTNDGDCVATGDDPTCGPGNQNQVRTCTDGSTDVCTDADTAQTIACALPDCVVEKVLGDWTNDGDCVATGDSSLPPPHPHPASRAHAHHPPPPPPSTL